MTTIADIADEVSVLVDGANILLLKREVLASAIRFCRETHALTLTDQIDLTDSVADYPLFASSEAEVISLISVTQGGRALKPLVEYMLDTGRSNWRSESSKDALGYYNPTVNTISPYPLPNADTTDPLIVKAAAAPKRTATTIDTEFYEAWRDGIIAGAVWSLLNMPARPWTDPVASLHQIETFKANVSEARARLFRGNSNAPARIKYPRFGG